MKMKRPKVCGSVFMRCVKIPNFFQQRKAKEQKDGKCSDRSIQNANK